MPTVGGSAEPTIDVVARCERSHASVRVQRGQYAALDWISEANRNRSSDMSELVEQPNTLTSPMEFVAIAGTPLVVSRIGLGTWAIGGWMWGGTDEQQSIRTIHEALDRGITLFDTAPVYG